MNVDLGPLESERVTSVRRAERLCEVACRALQMSPLPGVQVVRTGGGATPSTEERADDAVIDARRNLDQCIGRVWDTLDRELLHGESKLRDATRNFLTRQIARTNADREELQRLLDEVARG